MDKVSKETRSAIMSKVRSIGNISTERRFRSSLVRARIKSWLVRPKMQFSPDFIFETAPVAIFIDGCFWHGCPVCKNKIPSSNKDYWTPKLQRNIERDKLATNELTKQGWIVLRFWEHEIANNLPMCIATVKDALSCAPQSCFIIPPKAKAEKKMKGKPFYDWLMETENYSKKSAQDMVSRCRRVERIFNIDLDKKVVTKDGFIKMREKLRSEFNDFVKPGSAFSSSVSPIVVAVRKYHNFLISQNK